MTQIWPGFGEAPVPTVLSVICKPEAVVMVFPLVWAVAILGTATDMEIAAAVAVNTALTRVRRVDRIFDTFLERRTSLAQCRFLPKSFFRRFRAAIPIQREIAQQRRRRPRDQAAVQWRGKKAACDPVDAIAIGRIDAFGAGHGTDQRQPVAGGVERSGPAEFDVGIRNRPQRFELLHQQARLLRDQAIARIGLDNFVTVFPADDDTPCARGSRVEIVLAVLPDQRTTLPDILRLRRGCNGPAR